MFVWVLNTSLLRVENKKTDYVTGKTAPFYGRSLTVSRLQSHYEETVHFLQFIP